MIRLGFLASNNGTSMRAIVEAINSGQLDARAVVAISNRRAAPALKFAADHGIATHVIATAADPDLADEELAALLYDTNTELVVLSGYLRKLGPRTLAAYPRRILNIHPALLPRHGGVGMYGRRVHEAVLAAGDTVSGASVHIVDGEYDHGRIIAEVELPILQGDTAESLERRVMAAEPELFIETLQRIASGAITLE
jgi:phosphoribosylglycinamide formyltransferase-1